MPAGPHSGRSVSRTRQEPLSTVIPACRQNSTIMTCGGHGQISHDGVSDMNSQCRIVIRLSRYIIRGNTYYSTSILLMNTVSAITGGMRHPSYFFICIEGLMHLQGDISISGLLPSNTIPVTAVGIPTKALTFPDVGGIFTVYEALSAQLHAKY